LPASSRLTGRPKFSYDPTQKNASLTAKLREDRLPAVMATGRGLAHLA
jgi:hypothetical protein